MQPVECTVWGGRGRLLEVEMRVQQESGFLGGRVSFLQDTVFGVGVRKEERQAAEIEVMSCVKDTVLVSRT